MERRSAADDHAESRGSRPAPASCGASLGEGRPDQTGQIHRGLDAMASTRKPGCRQPQRAVLLVLSFGGVGSTRRVKSAHPLGPIDAALVTASNGVGGGRAFSRMVRSDDGVMNLAGPVVRTENA